MKYRERSKFSKALANKYGLYQKGPLAYKIINSGDLQVLLGFYFDNCFMPDYVECFYLIIPLYNKTDYLYFCDTIRNTHNNKTLMFSLSQIEEALNIVGDFYSCHFEDIHNIQELSAIIAKHNLILGPSESSRFAIRSYLSVARQQYDEALNLFGELKRTYDKRLQYIKDKSLYQDVLTVIKLIQTQQYDRLHSLLLEWQQETMKALKLPQPK